MARLEVGVPRGEGLQPERFNASAIEEVDLAWLEDLDGHEVIAWDLHTTRTSLATHPMHLVRPMLEGAGIRPTNRVHDGQHCAIAGLVIARQGPETARGIVFLFLEDEFGHCQGIIRTELWDALRSELRSRVRGWKTMVVESIVPIQALSPKESEMAYFVR